MTMAKINANYEALYILDPSLSEEQIAALVARFQSVVEANGTVSEVNEWGKRRLAYPINDEEEGVYTVINFTSEPIEKGIGQINIFLNNHFSVNI